MLIVSFDGNGYFILRAILRLIEAHDKALFRAKDVAHPQAIDELRPELAIVFLAVQPPQSPHLVETDPYHFARTALAIWPDGDQRLGRFSIGALVGGMLEQHLSLGMRHGHRLVPRQLAEIVPGAAAFRGISAKLHEGIAASMRRQSRSKLWMIRRGPQLGIGIDDHGQHIRQRRLVQLARPEPRTGDHDQPATELTYELLRQIAEAITNRRSRHIVKKQDI